MLTSNTHAEGEELQGCQDGDYNEAKDEEVFTMLSQSVPESLMKGKKTRDHRGDKKKTNGEKGKGTVSLI
jgi:hypothetical protein